MRWCQYRRLREKAVVSERCVQEENEITKVSFFAGSRLTPFLQDAERTDGVFSEDSLT